MYHGNVSRSTSFMKLFKYYKYEVLLLLLTAVSFLGTSGMTHAASRSSDYVYYQTFTEKLAGGEVDLSIPGFHGADFIGVLLYLITGASNSHILFQLICGLLIPFAAYKTANALFQDKRYGLLFAAITALMPYMSYAFVTGYTQAANMFFFLLTLWGAVQNRWWTGLTWAIAITTKPFALIALPFLLFFAPRKKPLLSRYKHLLIGLGIPAIYVLVQILQTGGVHVGVHGGTDSLVLWDGPVKLLGNAAWGLQTLFSVHNYYYDNPAITGHWNLLHTTPVLIFLGLYTLLNPREYFHDLTKHRTLLSAFLFGFVLNAIVSMDNFYMQFMVLMLILSSLPVLIKQPLWIPLVLATLHYQWFYFWLDFQDAAQLEITAFAVPLALDTLGIAWCLLHAKTVLAYVKRTVFLPLP